jgi:hypothetical protein
MIRLTLLATLGAALLGAQELDLSFLKDIESKAAEATNITLGKEQLQLIRGLTGDAKSELGALAASIELVQVKVLEFDRAGLVPMAEMEKLKSSLKAADMVPFMSVKERDGFTEIVMRKGPKGSRGFVILVAEEKELTIVNIVGDLDLASLGRLSGKFGIPNVEFGNMGAAPGGGKSSSSKPGAKKDSKPEDEDDQL